MFGIQVKHLSHPGYHIWLTVPSGCLTQTKAGSLESEFWMSSLIFKGHMTKRWLKFPNKSFSLFCFKFRDWGIDIESLHGGSSLSDTWPKTLSYRSSLSHHFTSYEPVRAKNSTQKSRRADLPSKPTQMKERNDIGKRTVQQIFKVILWLLYMIAFVLNN